MSNLDMMEALQMLAAERGITIDTLLSALAERFGLGAVGTAVTAEGDCGS